MDLETSPEKLDLTEPDAHPRRRRDAESRRLRVRPAVRRPRQRPRGRRARHAAGASERRRRGQPRRARRRRLLAGRVPDDEVIAKAVAEDLQLYATDADTFEVVGRLFALGVTGGRGA